MSNLKQVECWTRKLPIVCSDIPPYSVHGKHMENCMLVPANTAIKSSRLVSRSVKKLVNYISFILIAIITRGFFACCSNMALSATAGQKITVSKRCTAPAVTTCCS